MKTASNLWQLNTHMQIGSGATVLGKAHERLILLTKSWPVE